MANKNLAKQVKRYQKEAWKELNGKGKKQGNVKWTKYEK